MRTHGEVDILPQVTAGELSVHDEGLTLPVLEACCSALLERMYVLCVFVPMYQRSAMASVAVQTSVLYPN
jgi:hypothetical protein